MGLTTRVSIISANNSNRPGAKLRGGSPSYITLHETSNPAPSADAEMHRRFVHGGGGPHNVSFHAVVDDHESIQLLPWDEVAWHAGDGNGDGNRDSIGIEICVNKGANWQQTLANAAVLVAGLMKEFSIPIERVVQHNHWSGKNCPMTLRKGGWAGLIAQIELMSRPQPPLPQPTPDTDFYPQTGHSIGGAIRVYFHLHGGLERYGFPLEQETPRVLEDGRQYTTQLFERGMLHWRADEGVGEARIGAMYLALEGAA